MFVGSSVSSFAGPLNPEDRICRNSLMKAWPEVTAPGTLEHAYDFSQVAALQGLRNLVLASIHIRKDCKTLAVVESHDNQGLRGILVLFNVNGSLDTTFGTQGAYLLPHSMLHGPFVLLRREGRREKVLTVASCWLPNESGMHYCANQLAANGTPDLTFGAEGFKTLPIAANFRPQGFAELSSGKFLIYGYNGGFYFYGNDGSLETFLLGDDLDSIESHSTAASPNTYQSFAHKLFLDAEGSLVELTQFFHHSSGLFKADLLTGYGQKDFGYGGSMGMPEVPPGGVMRSGLDADTYYAQQDGSILIAGEGRYSTEDFSTQAWDIPSVLRITREGRIDPSFGFAGGVFPAVPEGGVFTVKELAGYRSGSVRLDRRERLILGAYERGREGEAAISLARGEKNGSLSDSSFGTDGIASLSKAPIFPKGFHSAVVRSMAVQADESILIAGSVTRNDGGGTSTTLPILLRVSGN